MEQTQLARLLKLQTFTAYILCHIFRIKSSSFALYSIGNKDIPLKQKKGICRVPWLLISWRDIAIQKGFKNIVIKYETILWLFSTFSIVTDKKRSVFLTLNILSFTFLCKTLENVLD